MLRSLRPTPLALGLFALTCLGCSEAEEVHDAPQGPDAAEPRGASEPETAPRDTAPDTAGTAKSIEGALADWNAAFDRALQVRGDHVADGVNAAIVVARGIAGQSDTMRQQMFPEPAASAPKESQLTVTVEQMNPEALEAAARVKELASLDVASRGDAGDDEWLATLRDRSYDLRVAVNRLEKLPLTVSVEVEDWPQPPAILSGRGGMSLQPVRTELQLRTMATFNAQAVATLRDRRAQALAADEVLELATLALNALLESSGGADVAELDAAMKLARAEYLTTTEDGDVDALAAEANGLATRLHALLQSRAIYEADSELLTARRANLDEVLETHPAWQTRRSVDAERLAEYNRTRPFNGRRNIRAAGGKPTIAEEIKTAEEDWRLNAQWRLEALPALENLEVDRAIEDPWHRSGTEELAKIDELLAEGATKLAQLDEEERSMRTELAAARASYAGASRALRAYETAKQRRASAVTSAD